MHALVAEIYAVAAARGGHAGAVRRVRPAALRGRRRRREGRGPPTRSSPGCARRPRTAAASGATSRSGTGPPRSPPTTPRCSPRPARHGLPTARPAGRAAPRWASWRPPAAMAEARLAALAGSLRQTARSAAVRRRRATRPRRTAGSTTHRQEIVDDLVAYAELESASDDLALLDGARLARHWLDERLGRPGGTRIATRRRHGDVVVLGYAGHRRPPPVTAARALRHRLARRHPRRLAGPARRRPHQRSRRLRHEGRAGPGGLGGAGAARAGLPRPRLRLLLNGDEEIGSRVSRAPWSSRPARRRGRAGLRGGAPTARSRPRARGSASST